MSEPKPAADKPAAKPTRPRNGEMTQAMLDAMRSGERAPWLEPKPKRGAK